MILKTSSRRNPFVVTALSAEESMGQASAALPFILASAALLFGIPSGSRWPNLWSATHLLFDYSNGFIKRGLTGEVLSHVFGDVIYYKTLATLSFAIFATWMFLLFLRLRALAKFDDRIWLLTAVVLVSPGFVFLVHEIGYLDHVGLVVVLLCSLMPANLAGLLGRILLCSLMVVAHETFFLMFFPAAGFQFWIRATAVGFRHPVAKTLILVAVVAATTYGMGQAALPGEQEAAYVDHLAQRAGDFPIRQDAVKVLFRDGRANIGIMSERWQARRRWVEAVNGAVVFLPLPFGLALACFSSIRRSTLGNRTRLCLLFGVILAAFSPLLLNVFAWDIWRFFALAQFSAFLVLVSVCEQSRGSLVPIHWNSFVAYGLTVLAIVGAVTATPLFDGYIVAKPPFLPRIVHVIDSLQGEAPWMRIPTQ